MCNGEVIWLGFQMDQLCQICHRWFGLSMSSVLVGKLPDVYLVCYLTMYVTLMIYISY